MKSIIEELWYGNIIPSEQSRKITSEAKEGLAEVIRYQDELFSTLTENQKKILEKLDDSYFNLAGINEREIFIYAFRLGAKFAIEVMDFPAE